MSVFCEIEAAIAQKMNYALVMLSSDWKIYMY